MVVVAAIPAVSAIAVAFAGAAADVLAAVVAAAAYQQDNDENDPQAGVVVVHAHKTITSLEDVVFYAVTCGKEHDRLKNIGNSFVNWEIEPLLWKSGEGGFDGKL